ncbi:hypothetical protein [Bacillus sp. SM2101]|uniref:hypothetical protein n=1 Tax=Bacillus sp. SM2101 TaxID=2805366 RepID=UPI001BDE4A06|nr:hypothetical protein [Bacillus sp. SM2101]
MALWEQCCDIYQDRNNAIGADHALAFYETNHQEMDDGADVLWPDVQPLYKLMK